MRETPWPTPAGRATDGRNTRCSGSCPACPICLCWPPPPSPAGPSRANRESLDFTLNGNRAERVQIVNVLSGVASAPALTVEIFGMARHVVQADAAQRLPELVFGGREDRKHHFFHELGARLRFGLVHCAGGAQ